MTRTPQPRAGVCAMASNHFQYNSVPVLALAALAATIFTAGSGHAPAPELACLDEGDGAALGIAIQEPLDPAQQALVAYLSRRFVVAQEATEQMVQVAHRAAQQVGLDPLLVLAVISIESAFNPIAESV